MRPFDNLLKELDEWNFAGEEATLWWRDDDAAAPDPKLTDLVSLLGDADVVPGLAVIPSDVTLELLDSLVSESAFAVMQHGVDHRNRMPEGRKKQELVDTDAWDWREALETSRERLESIFGQLALPVLVPPWNRIDDSMLDHLESLGFRGISCFGARMKPQIGEDLWVVNTHVDLVNWRGGRQFVGESAAIAALIDHLGGRREGRFDLAEPTGILSHHLVHGTDSFSFVERLLRTLDDHPAASWLSPEKVFQLRWR